MHKMSGRVISIPVAVRRQTEELTEYKSRLLSGEIEKIVPIMTFFFLVYGSRCLFRTYNVIKDEKGILSMAKCKCRNTTRIVSETVQNMCSNNTCMCAANAYGCVDVCRNPVKGDPKYLSLFAPLIYDEVGINLCATFSLGVDLATEYPTVTCASVRIANIAYAYGATDVSVEPITGRPNCYLIGLSNVEVTFAVDLYDATCRLITTVYPTAVYLPSDATVPTYDEDTNPSRVELELFAPYGTAFTGTGAETSRVINVIGFTSGSNFITQGINLYMLPKLIALDTDDNTVTVGVTLVLQSLYFAGYCVESGGKINTPKGSLSSSEESDCMQFVSGELLDLAIRPLDLGCNCNCNSNSCSNNAE